MLSPARASGTRPSRSVATGHVLGVHVARALALLGMLAVHLGPTGSEGLLGRLYAIPHGRASLLFVLVAGIGVSLLARSPRADGRTIGATLLWRATILLPLGLLLQPLDHGVNVILAQYAVLFLVALPALLLPDRGLLTAAVTVGVLGPAAILWGQITRPSVFTRDAVLWGEPLGDLLHGLVLSGPYPLVTWTAPLLLGMWLGRQDLRAPAFVRRLVFVGGAFALAAVATSHLLVAVLGAPSGPTSLDRLVISAAHSQMPLWLVGGTAAAVAVLGASLWLAERAPLLVQPLVATGTLAFTIYVGHLIVLAVAGAAFVSDEVLPAAATMLGVTAVLSTGSILWTANVGRGPLERLLRPPRWLTGAAQPSSRRSRIMATPSGTEPSRISSSAGTDARV